MIKIAHRGNVFGPDSLMENSPYHLLNAIDLGYDVEVDVWVNDNIISFGHDEPVFLNISDEFLIEIGNHAWFHCKNLEALHFFNTIFPQLNYFWHQEDDFTLTSQGYIWTYPSKETTKRSILVLEGQDPAPKNVLGVCSDYISLI